MTHRMYAWYDLETAVGGVSTPPTIYRDKLGFVWGKHDSQEEWTYLGYRSAKAWARLKRYKEVKSNDPNSNSR